VSSYELGVLVAPSMYAEDAVMVPTFKVDKPDEAVLVGLHPELVVLLYEQQDMRARLQQLGVPSLSLEQQSLAGLVSSFIILGSICQKEAQGALGATQFRDSLRCFRIQTAICPKIKTLLVLGRSETRTSEIRFFAVGRGQIYDELITAAGGVNAVTSADPPYPELGAKDVLLLDPDFIIECNADGNVDSRTKAERLKSWGLIRGLRAFRNQRVVILTGDYLAIPGPRSLLTLQALGRALHPEMNWDLTTAHRPGEH